MNSILMLITGALFCVSLYMYCSEPEKAGQHLQKLGPKKKKICIGMAGLGLIIAFGGFWVDALLWIGLIVGELSSIFALARR